MDTIVTKCGDVPYVVNPGVVVADAWDGNVVFLVKTRPDEDIDDLIKQAKHMRKLRILTNRAEKRRREVA